MRLKYYCQKRENVKECNKGRECNYFGFSSAWPCVRFKTRTSEDTNSASYREKTFCTFGMSA